MTDKNELDSKKPSLEVYLANPRGFCAGVERAIRLVEEALDVFGAPVYVRHEIVHNLFVVNNLKSKGVIFVKELSDVPAGDRPVILSAHGVSKSVKQEGERRNLRVLDATCPLVTKVHREAERFHADGLHVLLIGHKGHPEVAGTVGQLPAGCVTLIESEEDALNYTPAEPEGSNKSGAKSDSKLAYVTQTTLSVDDTASIIKILLKRFPNIVSPRRSDICYATTNRQAAVRELAKEVETIFIIGSSNSSNSCRLVELARGENCRSLLVEDANSLPIQMIKEMVQQASKPAKARLGISAGASAPDELLDQIIARLGEDYNVSLHSVGPGEESVVFKSPPVARLA